MTKKSLKTPLFLAASFLLVGCSSDTIVARPTWQNDNIIEDSSGIKDNKMKSIYDAIKKLGDTNSSVLTNVMQQIAEKHIGKFSDLQTYGGYDDKTQMSEIEKLIDTAGFKKFVNEHPLYKADEKGAIRNGTTVTVKSLSDKQKSLNSFYKIQQQYNQFVEDIYEKLYNEIKGGSYSTAVTKLYREQYFVDHLIKELYTVNNATSYTLYSDLIFLPKPKEDTYKKHVNKYLHVVTEETGQLTKTTTGIYDDYINRKIIPELFKTYLTETYVKEQRFSSLGRSYARKVNMLSITVDSTNRTYVPKMLTNFAETYICKTDDVISYDFENISKAMIGFVGIVNTEIPYKLLGDAGFPRLKIYYESSLIDDFIYVPQYDSTKETHVFEGTKLAELVNKIVKCCDITINSSTKKIEKIERKVSLNSEQLKIYNELTGNNAYPVKKGIAIKEREILQTDYTKDGWFLKNGGLSDLNSDIKERLYNITTSSQIDSYDRKSDTEYKGTNEYIKYYGSTTTAENIANRKAFMILPTDSKKEADKVVLNKGDNNYYIIEVEEAANTSKLSEINNNNSYMRLKADSTVGNEGNSVNEYNKIVREIVKSNSSSDTYKKNANQYYLMISNIVFYDQSVYDYFKSQFPDLFK